MILVEGRQRSPRRVERRGTGWWRRAPKGVDPRARHSPGASEETTARMTLLAHTDESKRVPGGGATLLHCPEGGPGPWSIARSRIASPCDRSSDALLP